jgi:hypothetical protein
MYTYLPKRIFLLILINILFLNLEYSIIRLEEKWQKG